MSITFGRGGRRPGESGPFTSVLLYSHTGSHAHFPDQLQLRSHVLPEKFREKRPGLQRMCLKAATHTNGCLHAFRPLISGLQFKHTPLPTTVISCISNVQ